MNASKSKPPQENKGDSVTFDSRGNDRSYTLARLHRDHPALAERVERGELSANAAAIEAGFRKKPTPLDTLKREWTKASRKERNQFMRWTEQ